MQENKTGPLIFGGYLIVPSTSSKKKVLSPNHIILSDSSQIATVIAIHTKVQKTACFIVSIY